MPLSLELSAVGRLPAPGDNVAIATRRIEAGAVITLDGTPRTLLHTVLEGHRFAVKPIARGAELLSWGLPFGVALRDLAPGEYVCNQFTLDALAQRELAGAVLPAAANFENRIAPFVFDEAAFRPASQVALAPELAARTFLGYPRAQGRGAATRNTIVILGTTSRTASFARQLAERLKAIARVHPALDGLVAIGHTEGDGPGTPNNLPELLRTLAGFMVNPNVGAVLAVDYGSEPVNNAVLREFMERTGYPLSAVPHHFLTIGGGVAAALAEGERIVRAWLPTVAAQRREPVPLSHLRLGMQCGGSDAFSGVSANPLIGTVAREVVRSGGAVNLAETDELVGAESYILRRVKDLATARRFLEMIALFKERLGWHGATVEGNPSGGNRFRGLYNIVLKSLGAAMKKDPEIRLDHVIDYAEPMRSPGFYFMNSPGNDLESVAGQVGAGCNLIIFTTGNGSVTNFPFVPTLKVTSTTRRHQLLINEMDVNAGAYLDGTPMAALTAETFALLQEVASGRRTRGEHAGHSQVSIWRNWRQSDPSRLAALRARLAPDGKPLAMSGPPPDRTFAPFAAGADVGLIVPTSMCSSQIARLAAERLNASGLGRDRGIARFAALAHTEGCGFAGETMYQLLQRTYCGYVNHPSVARALFLEHGCEKIPNDVIRRRLIELQVDPARYGWASVQLDGGIEKVLTKVEAWFAGQIAALPLTGWGPTSGRAITLGLLTEGPVQPATADAVGILARLIVDAGGSTLLPEGDPLMATAEYRARTIGSGVPRATLAYGESLRHPGFHLVATETDHWVENLTGLGGCGAQIVLGVVRSQAKPGHPFIPVVQVAAPGSPAARTADDVDAVLTGNAEQDLAVLWDLLQSVAGGARSPAAAAHGLVDFQLTRGLLGVST